MRDASHPSATKVRIQGGWQKSGRSEKEFEDAFALWRKGGRMLAIVLYGLAAVLFLYIASSVIRTKKFGVSDALALLGIVITIILAQKGPDGPIMAGSSTAIPIVTSQPTRYGSPTPNNSIVDPTSTITPLTPTQTTATAVSKSIDSGDGYKIEQICSGQTGAEMHLILPKGFPVEKLDAWYIYPVVRDIKGNLQEVCRGCGTDLSFSFSPLGIAKDDVPVGNWLVRQNGAVYTAHLYGWWGNTIVGEIVGDQHEFVFPVIDGCITKSTVSPGKLEIGVLNTDHTKALVDISVYVYCQGKDIAGNIIPDARCPGREYGVFEPTDATGVATFFLGPGTYFIKYKPRYEDFAEYKYLHDVKLNAGEEKRIIVDYA
jgi:hypothetical protein